MKRRLLVGLAAALTLGCAGIQKSCSQFGASSFGANWIVVQYGFDGKPFHCWKLMNVAVDDSTGGNVDWQTRDGHLVHLTGWENRVQVRGNDFAGAARLVGVDADQCDNGTYPASSVK
jgi:hypothetical protein